MSAVSHSFILLPEIIVFGTNKSWSLKLVIQLHFVSRASKSQGQRSLSRNKKKSFVCAFQMKSLICWRDRIFFHFTSMRVSFESWMIRKIIGTIKFSFQSVEKQVFTFLKLEFESMISNIFRRCYFYIFKVFQPEVHKPTNFVFFSSVSFSVF